MPWKLPPDQSAMGGIYGAQDLPFWLQSGMAGEPPQGSFPPDLSTSRMRRIQESRPSQWDQEIPPENLLGLIPGGMAGRLIASAPRLATGVLAAYYGMSGTDPAGGAPKQQQASVAPSGNADDIKRLQEELRPYGYQGPIDGVWKAGTQRAYEAKQQADQQRVQQQDIEARRIDAEARDRDAVARGKETERQAEADRIRSAERDAGQKRFNEAEANVGGFSRLMRDYSTPVGVTAGALAGPGARALINRVAGGPGREVASMMGRKMSATPDRVGRINEVWRQGGRGGEVPFTNMPGQKSGYAVNPNTAPMGELYQPNKALNFATDAGVAGGFVGESALTGYLAHGWEEELKQASAAAATDMSDVNISRLQQAKDNVAFYEGLSNAGRAGGASYLTAAKLMKRPGKPNLSTVEAEKLKLEALLRRGQPAPSAMPAPSPVAQALVPPSQQQVLLPPPGKRPPWMRADNENAQFDPFLDYRR